MSRPYDAVCRYGGEEFVILMPETDLAGAKKIAFEIRKAIMDLAIAHDSSSVAEIVTVSQGISCFIPNDTNSPMLLIQAADEALYKGKHSTRNAIAIDGEK